ncbi:hypothetical protein BVG81_006690 [Haliangium sp. UPWRP_2]|nr:hypothetical protein BVG81_006690 [Haliangium sp. UPWRP_2]
MHCLLMCRRTRLEVTPCAPAQKSRPSQLPAVVAALGLAEEDRRRLSVLIRRLHRGRWPLLLPLAMRQVGGVLCEAVLWRKGCSPHFGLVTWRADGPGLSWQGLATRQAALTTLRGLR